VERSVTHHPQIENIPEMLPADWQIRRKCPGFANPGRAGTRISDDFSIYWPSANKDHLRRQSWWVSLSLHPPYFENEVEWNLLI